MANENWVPVVAALVGASISLGASFLVAFFNKSTQEANGTYDRDRKRLERVYELLIKIKIEYGYNMGDALSFIHYATPFPVKEIKDMPPLVELEMLVNLYFKCLKPDHIAMQESIHKFGAELMRCRLSNYKNTPLKEKQLEAEKFLNLVSSIESNIKLFQESISKLIKA